MWSCIDKAAFEDYGVVVRKEQGNIVVDDVQTSKKRESIRQERGALEMFNRGPYFEKIKRENGIVRPEHWEDPDKECYAVKNELS